MIYDIKVRDRSLYEKNMVHKSLITTTEDEMKAIVLHIFNPLSYGHPMNNFIKNVYF